MAERIQKTKQTTESKQEIEELPETDTKEELKDEMDDLLDEIDGLLEENAQEFVSNYIQKGGE